MLAIPDTGYVVFLLDDKYKVQSVKNYQNDQARYTGRVKIIEILQHSWEAYQLRNKLEKKKT